MKSKLALTTLLGISAAFSASAAPIFSTTYNGSAYDLYEDAGISWADAQANAVGLGGYLAVLTDNAETQAVYNALIGNGFFTANDGQPYSAYLGAIPADDSSSTTDATNWKWVTGEAWSTENQLNFASGEPNGDSEGLTINRYGNWTFNDESGPVGGYIVETRRETRSVPDGGSTVAMLGAAMAAVAFVRRKTS